MVPLFPLSVTYGDSSSKGGAKAYSIRIRIKAGLTLPAGEVAMPPGIDGEEVCNACRPPGRRALLPRLFPIHLRHVLDQIQHLAGIAPLVVIPGDELNEVVPQHYAGPLVDYTGVGIAPKVG